MLSVYQQSNFVLAVSILLFVGIFFMPLLSAEAQDNKQEGAIRVAIITGGHEYDKEPFNEMWASMSNIQPNYFDYSSGKCAFFDNDRYKEFDVIVLYNFHQKITKDQQKNFLDMLHSGKKLIVLHHAVSAFPEWDEFAKIIGAKYFSEDTVWDGKKYERSKYKHDVKVPVHVVDKNHPITQGIDDFEEIDEVYSQYQIFPDVHVLLTTNHPDSASFLSWVNKYENTEVFFMELGHGPQSFKNEQFRKMMNNAILWAAEKSEKNK